MVICFSLRPPTMVTDSDYVVMVMITVADCGSDKSSHGHHQWPIKTNHVGSGDTFVMIMTTSKDWIMNNFVAMFGDKCSWSCTFIISLTVLDNMLDDKCKTGDCSLLPLLIKALSLWMLDHHCKQLQWTLIQIQQGILLASNHHLSDDEQ